MTDSSDPRRPKSSRKKPSREPATIDLKATVIDTGTVQAGAAQDTPGQDAPVQTTPDQETLGQDTLGQDTLGQSTLGQDTLGPVPAAETISPGGTPDLQPAETIAGGHEPRAEDAVASPEATLDSGAGTDTLPSGASVEEPGRPDAIPSDSSFQESSTQESSTTQPRDAAVPPPLAPERRGSAGALIGAGLLGGVVGAGLLYGVQAWQAGSAQPRLAQLEQRVNALGQQPASAPAGTPPAEIQTLTGRLQALEGTRGDLDQRLQAIQDTAQQAAAQAQEALNRPAPEAPQPAPQTEAALTELSNRLSGLEEQVRAGTQAAQNAATATQDLDRRVADLDRRLAEQDSRFGNVEQRFGEVQSRFADVERRFADTERRFAEQEQRLAGLSQQAAESARTVEAASQTGTKVVLAGRLNDALKSGTPYAQVLDGVRTAGADPSRVAPLEPFAQQGAPTAEALARSFEPVETAILRESRGPAEDWTDRLLRMADRVVTVRPVNEPGSTGVPALAARIRQALERGDIMEAASAWDSLPEPSRRLSDEWGRQLKAVAEAHRAAQAISSDALATLNRTTQ